MNESVACTANIYVLCISNQIKIKEEKEKRVLAFVAFGTEYIHSFSLCSFNFNCCKKKKKKSLLNSNLKIKRKKKEKKKPPSL